MQNVNTISTDTYEGSLDAQVLMEKLTFQGDTGMLLDWVVITLMASPNGFGIWVKAGKTQLQSLQKKIKHNNT